MSDYCVMKFSNLPKESEWMRYLNPSVFMFRKSGTIQALHAVQPTLAWYARAFRREAGTALLLGSACGIVVGLIVWLWHGSALPAFSIAASIVLTLCASCFFGLSVPALLHAFRL